MPKHLTTDQKERILAVYEETKMTRLTADRVGVTYEQVRHFLGRQGLPRTGAAPDGTCWRHRDLVERLAAEGASLTEIQRQIGGNRRHIVAFLKRYKIPYAPFRQVGPNNPAWRGGRMIDKHGYVLIHRPDHPDADRHGYVREHRLVMEEHLGRRLLPTEIVHHGPGGHQDNRPENLTIYDSNGEHLANTLKGKPHRISPEGLDRMRESAIRTNTARRNANRPASGKGGQP